VRFLNNCNIIERVNECKFAFDIFQEFFSKDQMITNKAENAESKVPFFSVIITTYNRAGLLIRALESLTSQEETDWEGIIVDDGSTDDTAIAVLPYLKPGSNFRYIRQQNTGYSDAKNTGIFSATGKYVTFLDSDDEYTPQHLASRKKILNDHTWLQFLHGGLQVIGSPLVPDRFDHSKMISISDCVIAGTFFIRRDVAVLFKGFKKIDLGSDGEFFERLESAGITIMKTDIPTYVYHRDTPHSITNSFAQDAPIFENLKMELLNRSEPE
jgi:glycosyltransferase involved in cell wall biosynthesis